MAPKKLSEVLDKKPPAPVADPIDGQDSIEYLPVNKIAPNPQNPRKMDTDPASDAFPELVASVKEHGVLQPIIVRPRINLDGPESYELVAGERRWRAATVAGLKVIPAIVRDMDDNEAFEVMTIENLQREDLTEAEEARSFKAYVDAKGPAAIEDLAQRSGISPRYIRRRVRVMELPANILKEWEEGKIAFGVLEQLLRLDPDKVEDFHKRHMKNDWDLRVDRVKSNIDDMAIPLGGALFKAKEAGCPSCPANSKVQVSLFGDDFAEKKVNCMNPVCFVEKQRAFLTENWPETKFAKEYGTNGFAFQEETGYDKYESFYTGKKPWEKCRDCSSFVTILSRRGQMTNQTACVNPPCYRSQSKAKEAGNGPKPVKNLGPEFQDRFYRERIPEVVNTMVPFDDGSSLRIVALALITNSERTRSMFFDDMGMKHVYAWEGHEKIWKKLEELDNLELTTWIQRVSLYLTLEDMQIGSSLSHKHLMAKHLGVDLKTEWRLHEDYLKRKTIPEILDLCKELKILTDPKVVEFAAGTLKMKTDRYDTLKKKDLIRLILESGVDLAGRVPKEIFTTKKEA
jgi:ParB/RepB/Spo0J family partition protein